MTARTELPVTEHVLSGNRACAGCGIGIGLRAITKALDGQMVLVNPASCLTVLGGMFPIASLTSRGSTWPFRAPQLRRPGCAPDCVRWAVRVR